MYTGGPSKELIGYRLVAIISGVVNFSLFFDSIAVSLFVDWLSLTKNNDEPSMLRETLLYINPPHHHLYMIAL